MIVSINLSNYISNNLSNNIYIPDFIVITQTRLNLIGFAKTEARNNKKKSHHEIQHINEMCFYSCMLDLRGEERATNLKSDHDISK